ncbi:MAG: Gfo/Idh/MocA family oxidoreductase [Asticcacaulis sp.]
MTGKALKIGLIGLGKIAVDQHVPSIRANPGLELVAGCSPHARPDGVKAYPTYAEMIAAHPEIEAVAICTPPQIRHAVAAEVIASAAMFSSKSLLRQRLARPKRSSIWRRRKACLSSPVGTRALRRRSKHTPVAAIAPHLENRHRVEGKRASVAPRPGVDIRSRRHGGI